MGTDEEAVAALVAARAEALVSGDADRMLEILAPDFTYTNASGVSCDREEYVASFVGSSDLVWLAQESSALEVRGYGDAAVVTLDVHDRATWRGEPFEGDFRSLFVYVRRGGTWRCVAGQTTALDAGRVSSAPRMFTDARLALAEGVAADAEVIAPLHAYALGHATGSPEHFRRAFRPTAHIEGIRDGEFVSWELDSYCALFDGPAAGEDQRSRIVESVHVSGTVATATMRLDHGENTFIDLFLLVRDAGGWQIANKVYHRVNA